MGAFTCYFTGMFISLFGTGMNFAGVSLYVLGKTHSTVQVSFTVILLTLPRLVVPPFGGVLTDRVDRRYLSIALDLVRAVDRARHGGRTRLAASASATMAALRMVLLLGAGFAIYWSSSLALLQELIPGEAIGGRQFRRADCGAGGMLLAGALGRVHLRARRAWPEYWPSMAPPTCSRRFSFTCFGSGYFPPHGVGLPTESGSTDRASLSGESPAGERLIDETGTAPAEHSARIHMLPRFSSSKDWSPIPVRSVLRDIDEGLHYLHTQPAVLALGLTYACMMAGVISANVIVVALASDLLHVGARGYGFIEAGWALGAVAGGLAAAELSRRHPFTVMICGAFRARVRTRAFPVCWISGVAVAMNVAIWRLPRDCGGADAIVDPGGVPSRLMGRTQSAFAVMATVLQVVMSLALGWLAQHSSLQIAFLMLGLLYAAAIFAAMRARDLSALPTKQAAVI